MSLPVSTGVVAGPQPTVPPSAFFATLGLLRDAASNTFKKRKPWTEVFDYNSLSKPSTFTEATTRLRKNVTYFKINYLIMILILTAVTFVMHPSALFAVGLLCSAWVYLLVIRTTPLVIGGRTLSDREKLIGMGVVSFIVVFYTGVGTTLFSALLFSAVVVAAHGATRQPDDLFIDDVETNQGFLAGILGSAPPATHSNAV